MSARSRPKKSPTVKLRMTSSADPSSRREKKNYPKSARHAKSNTDALNNRFKLGADDSNTQITNIKPSSTQSRKYKNKSKRHRAQTSANVFDDDDDEDNGNNNNEDDEKSFFSGKSKTVRHKSSSSKSKRSKKNNKNRNKDDLDLAASRSSKHNNDLSNEFALPEFIIDHGNDALLNSTLTVFEIKKEYNIQQIDEVFNEFEKSLHKRKEECIAMARNAYDNNKFVSISIDIDGTHDRISQIGTKLGEKEFELEKEQTLCIDKLREIIYFEDHSNDTKDKLKELQKTLAIEANKIEQDKARVKAELAKVEPKLKAAQEAVSGIPKSSLDEFRALRKPAPILVDVVRAVAILVGKKEKDLGSWNNVRRVMDSKFIDGLLNFDAKHLTSKARKIIEVKYLQRADFTFERINQASTVAGPFVFWLASQIDYARLWDEVSPIQREVDRLQFELKLNEKKAEMLQQMLVELSKRVKECRYEMMEMVRKIVKLQDDIKVFRQAHAEKDAS